MKNKKMPGIEGESKSIFDKKGKIVVARAHPIVKSPLMDWARENHKLLEKCKGKIAFKGRVRD